MRSNAVIIEMPEGECWLDEGDVKPVSFHAERSGKAFRFIF